METKQKDSTTGMIGTLFIWPLKADIVDKSLLKKPLFIKFHIGNRTITTENSNPESSKHPSWSEGINFIRTIEEKIKVSLNIANPKGGEGQVVGEGSFEIAKIIEDTKKFSVDLWHEGQKTASIEFNSEFYLDMQTLKNRKPNVLEAITNNRLYIETESPLKLQKTSSRKSDVDTPLY